MQRSWEVPAEVQRGWEVPAELQRSWDVPAEVQPSELRGHRRRGCVVTAAVAVPRQPPRLKNFAARM